MREVLRLYFILKDFRKQMTRKNIGAFASSVAFFTFISLIPLTILLVALLPYTPITETGLVNLLEEFSPTIFDQMIQSVVSDIYASNGGIVTISLLVTVWSAAKAMLAMIRGLNEINDVKEDRNYFLLRLVACLYTVIFMLAMIIMMILLLFGRGVIARIIVRFPELDHFFRYFIHLRFLVFWFVLTIILGVIYTYVPNKKMSLKKQLPGALFSAIVWSVASWGFSIYIEYFYGYNTYGSLSTVILLLIYLYLMMYIIMIGAHINRYFGPIYKFLFGWLDKRAKSK